MSDQRPRRADEQHPVAAGIGALVGVAVVVGLVLGLVVLAGTKVLGIGGGSEVATDTGGQGSVYIPRPEKTPTPSGPAITLAPGSTGSEKPGKKPSRSPSESESPRREIVLTASATSAAPMQQFNLTGTYPGGEGAILTVQRFQDGQWVDFPATGSVSGEAFSIAVQTSFPGSNRFRVVDSDTDLVSDEVRVTIG